MGLRMRLKLEACEFEFRVRMGSFTSAPKIPREDTADDDLAWPNTISWSEISQRCQQELLGWPQNIPREIVNVSESGGDRIRVMQWNVLAQALAEGSDHFVSCPPDALSWTCRRWRLLGEIAAMKPDIICLQEVDHYKFFKHALAAIGFHGIFYPKPDSPCLYIAGNNGPDGCAVFVNTSMFDVLEEKHRCLEVWTCQTNQVMILCKLRRRSDNAEFWISSTHLKARSGHFLELMRREQGRDILNFVKSAAGDKVPLLLTGDMNATPGEQVHTVFQSAGLKSAYCSAEPSYTSWTIREDGEHCQTLDYILYSQDLFQVERLLQVPSDDEIGPTRVPSHRYPSDHFALIADLVIPAV